MPDAGEALSSARAGLGEVCRLLRSPSPQALDQCTPLLERAAAELAGCLPEPGRTAKSDAAGDEARRLRLAVQHAHRLLEGAAAYHRNWIRRLGALSAGYTGCGEPARIEHGRHMLFEG